MTLPTDLALLVIVGLLVGLIAGYAAGGLCPRTHHPDRSEHR